MWNNDREDSPCGEQRRRSRPVADRDRGISRQDSWGDIWTIPNFLTSVRILLTPVFISLFLQSRYWSALAVYTLAAVTDGLDGFIAKRFGMASRLGAVLDPLADKALLVTSFLCIAARGYIPLWLAVLVVTRDLIIVGGLFFVHFAGVDLSNRIRPTWMSKCNTVAQFSLVVLVLALAATHRPGGWLLTVLVGIVAVLTTISCVQYVRIGLRLMSEDSSGE